ncbi:site-specific DNA-methyltransferase [Lysinibacillus sp. NPDC098008]|uniref:site-specific DNA-methyltransferase n=1 Tax=Lysinibacillus sp. NPDC098008 TaxID=3364146 RepID=UPI003801C54C
MSNKTKLELTWIGKDNPPKLEPRILIEDPELSYRAEAKVTDNDIFDNRLIFGDNLLALRALEDEFTGKIKCIYIDPPYNTGNAFEHYDDGLEHSIWLSLMRQRIELFYSLLHEEGSLFIHLDDSEVDYCKVILDEIFGRANFVNRITIEARSPSAFSTVNPGVFKASEYILWYCKDKSEFQSKTMRIEKENIDKAYNKFLLNKEKSRDEWKLISLNQAFLESWNEDRIKHIKEFVNDNYEFFKEKSNKEIQLLFEEQFTYAQMLKLSNVKSQFSKKAKQFNLEEFSQWAYLYLLERVSAPYKENDYKNFVLLNAEFVCREAEIDDDGAGKQTVDLKNESLNEIGKFFTLEREGYDTQVIRNGKQIIFYNKNVESIEGKLTPTKLLTNIWSDISWEGIAKEGDVKFKKGKKPEKLIQRCIELATSATDSENWVLDSFGGSGTTAAVAHKIGRKWVMVELGEHCHTHIIPRLKKVINGTDQAGISKSVNWKGGGGFKYYRLAPSLLEKDKFGNWIISKNYNPAMLAEAMCKHKGFTYAPDEQVYWKQGYSTENDYIYTTTQFITPDVADNIQEQMKEEETLLICCKAFTANPDNYPNITFVKIPTTILKNCEYGRDDYSLNVDSFMENENKEQLSFFVEEESNE